MDTHTTIILHWHGPFTYEEVEEHAHLERGVYLISGKIKQRQPHEIQYCGITEGSFWARLKNHHKAPQVNREQEFWLAQVFYPETPSRHFLETAESIIVYFWQPALNDKKKAYPPKPVTLVNHWFKKDGKPRHRQHPICKDIDDVLCWDGKLWRTGNLTVSEDDWE